LLVPEGRGKLKESGGGRYQTGDTRFCTFLSPCTQFLFPVFPNTELRVTVLKEYVRYIPTGWRVRDRDGVMWNIGPDILRVI
jgi:hypothetical protein